MVDGTVIAEAVHKQHQTPEGANYTRMKYVVEYRDPSGELVRTEVLETEKFGSKAMKSLTREDAAPLLIERKSGKVKFDIDDPRIDVKARTRKAKRDDEADFQRALKG